MQRLQKWMKWGLVVFVAPPLCGFWWWLGQGVSAQGVQFLSQTVRVRATPRRQRLAFSRNVGVEPAYACIQ